MAFLRFLGSRMVKDREQRRHRMDKGRVVGGVLDWVTPSSAPAHNPMAHGMALISFFLREVGCVLALCGAGR